MTGASPPGADSRGGLLLKIGTELFGGEDGGVHGGVPSGVGSAVPAVESVVPPAVVPGSAVPVVLVVWAFTRLIAAARSS